MQSPILRTKRSTSDQNTKGDLQIFNVYNKRLKVEIRDLPVIKQKIANSPSSLLMIDRLLR